MKSIWMAKQVAENPVNPITLPNLNLVTRICFAQNSQDVMADYLTVDFMMQMLGYVCLKIRKGNMTGLNTKMEQGLDVKDNVQTKSKLTVGGDGYFGIVPIVSASAMHQDPIRIGTGLSNPP